MSEIICHSCKHEGTDKNPFCKDADSTGCSNYEIHATKNEVAALRAERDVLKKQLEEREKEVERLEKIISDQMDLIVERMKRANAYSAATDSADYYARLRDEINDAILNKKASEE